MFYDLIYIAKCLLVCRVSWYRPLLKLGWKQEASVNDTVNRSWLAGERNDNPKRDTSNLFPKLQITQSYEAKIPILS